MSSYFRATEFTGFCRTIGCDTVCNAASLNFVRNDFFNCYKVTMAAQVQEQFLTPSEVVLLFGDRFVKKSMLGEKLLLVDKKVSMTELAYTMMTAGIFACQARGQVTLNIEKGKALFGLMKTEKLKVAGGNAPVDWPQHSFESAFLRALGSQQIELDDLIIAYIGGIAASPEQDFIFQVKSALADRGILTAETKKTLGIFSSTNVSVTPEQRARIEQHGPADVTSLIANAEKTQPEIFRKVKQAVSSAFANRTQSDSGGAGD